MDETKLKEIKAILINCEIKPQFLLRAMNNIEDVVDSNYQHITDVICDIETWSNTFKGDMMYRVTQSESEFKVEPSP